MQRSRDWRCCLDDALDNQDQAVHGHTPHDLDDDDDAAHAYDHIFLLLWRVRPPPPHILILLTIDNDCASATSRLPTASSTITCARLASSLSLQHLHITSHPTHCATRLELPGRMYNSHTHHTQQERERVGIETYDGRLAPAPPIDRIDVRVLYH